MHYNNLNDEDNYQVTQHDNIDTISNTNPKIILLFSTCTVLLKVKVINIIKWHVHWSPYGSGSTSTLIKDSALQFGSILFITNKETISITITTQGLYKYNKFFYLDYLQLRLWTVDLSKDYKPICFIHQNILVTSFLRHTDFIQAI